VNLPLLDPGELRQDGTARLTGRRAAHVSEVLRAGPGDRVLAGVVGGRMGDAEVLAASGGELVLRPALDRDPPPPSPVSLLLALPRPKILRKVLQAAASMGVKRILLLGSWRVEKSYFASPLLVPEAMRAELLLGLEQGRDTAVPEVLVRRFFKPFVEDELAAILPERTKLLAHPAGAEPLERRAPEVGPAALAIGPEGGWTPYEAQELRQRGFEPFSLGARVLRVDAAVPYAVGQVELWLRAAGRLLP
jgi:16S rRNA (uracil1498-N3)-methyltransferase